MPTSLVPELSYADLTGANLSGANLTFAYLFDTNLTGASVDLTDAIDASCLQYCPIFAPIRLHLRT